jgi:GPH family glycoside/pentoside/hexuronide:cation symporter
MSIFVQPLKISEKIGYALGDGAANIAWRGVATFLFIFYTDVFGIHPATVGVLMLIARFGDGIVDVFMGIICDRTHTKYGKFRPWILWTAVPLGISLSLLFTAPALSNSGKVWYAYATYLLFFLIYTANNIPYGALMAVMTGDNKERTSLGSYRMVGAFSGGMIVQGALLYLVAHFGNINPTIDVKAHGSEKFIVTVSSPKGVENVNIKTKAGIALFSWQIENDSLQQNEATKGKSFSMEPNKQYVFLVSGEPALSADKISIIDQKKGYSSAIYVLSFFLSFFLLVTFAATKERVLPPADQETNLKKDFRDLVNNKPWLVLLIIGMLFNVYNSIKQGIVVMYFSHFMQNQLLSASYMIALMLASIAGALITAPLGKKWGKRKLFIVALLFSGFTNALLAFCTPNDVAAIFSIGIISEFGAAIFPTLFFAMLGDVADYSEFVNGRRATGLVYSAGSFATKFGGGIAGAIIGLVLAAYHYNGLDAPSIKGALPGIVMLMSWIPALISLLTAAIMGFYPLTQSKMDEITAELQRRRLEATLA